ncbi:LysR family transcriptional regulator [Serratia proteamaculans]|uniref:LysR family transcriptional regulator n=1 Tax=Serratia proteamaculans TaxID=28151 RepID=UPI001C596AE4|nr:LysR family transcriptional regulator [Serratia proteamaculans]WEO92231.1 LysR family transcriptional regulator [Serratia proteamaculans]
MNDRLTGITTFVQVVEAGNFALAAERLHLTRSAVGKSIARLEQRLGVLLFHRNPRGLNLTLEGQAYYDRCLRALSELDAADAELDSGRREPQGGLRVSAPKLLGRHCITPILMRLLDSYPELRIDIRLNDRVADLVEDGFDLAVRIGPLADSASLIARRLGEQYLALCAAPAYLAARGTPEDIAALDGHSGVAYHRFGEDIGWRQLLADPDFGDLNIDIRLRVDDLHSLADAAVAGAGLVWLPNWLLTHYLRNGALVPILGHIKLIPSEIHAVWPHTRYLPAKTRAAIDALLAQMPVLLQGI